MTAEQRVGDEVTDLVLAAFTRRPGRALFVTELAHALRPRPPADLDDALDRLAADWRVVVRDHYCGDPHLAGIDLRIAALVESDSGEAGQLRAIATVEAAWNEWLADFLANHRCG